VMTSTPTSTLTPIPTPDPDLFRDGWTLEQDQLDGKGPLYIAVPRYEVASSLTRSRFPPGTVTPSSGARYLWVQLAFYSQAHEARRMRITADAEYEDVDLRLLPTEFLVSPLAGGVIAGPVPRIPGQYTLSPGAVELFTALFLLPKGADPTQVRVVVSIEVHLGSGSLSPSSFGFALENGKGKSSRAIYSGTPTAEPPR
jgi:hypothetical protein